MAVSKHPMGRYQVIDRELRRRDFVKTKELKEIIEKELSVSVSERMINEDIKAMQDDNLLGYDAPIEYNNSKKAYFYSDPNYTIKAFGLKEEDINALLFYAKTINQYKDYDIFKDFTNAIDKVLDAVNIRKGIKDANQTRVVVLTENVQTFSGNEWIPKIVEALDTNSFIEFDYQKFQENIPQLKKLQPYLLKEDRHLWYVVGMNNKGDVVTYALDRIKHLSISEEKFIPCLFDFEDYFKFSFGITVKDETPIEVVLAFTNLQGHYLKTLKIHSTQKILIDNSDELRISVTVRPSWEFYEKILGYGESVKIISPEAIKKEMKKKIDCISGFYK